MVREGLSGDGIKIEARMIQEPAYKELGEDEMCRDPAEGQMVELGERRARHDHSGCCAEKRL